MSSEINDIIIKDEYLKDISSIIKFLLILDNSGKRIYCIYYTSDYNTLESQIDFETRLSRVTEKYSVNKNELDIFNFENYNILCRIDKEIAIFIGQDENENELLLEQFFKMFETQLFNFVGENLSREKILNHYNEIILLIDEMITGGVVINLDENSIYNRIKNVEKKQKSNENTQSGGGIMSGIFGYFTGKNYNQTPNDQKKEEKETSNIFGDLMASAKGYLKKNIEY